MQNYSYVYPSLSQNQSSESKWNSDKHNYLFAFFEEQLHFFQCLELQVIIFFLWEKQIFSLCLADVS